MDGKSGCVVEFDGKSGCGGWWDLMREVMLMIEVVEDIVNNNKATWQKLSWKNI